MRAIGALAAALVVVVAACEGGPEDEGPVEESLEEIREATGADTLQNGEEVAAEDLQRVEVQATSFAYDPSTIAVDAGRVRFVVHNASDVVHGFEVEGHGMEAVLDEIPPGATDSLTVDLAGSGEYEIYCPVGDHEARGMTGTLTVE